MPTTTIEKGATAAPAREEIDEILGEWEPQPPYAVILHNDPISTFEFVIAVLQKVFGYALEKAFLLTVEAHETGRSIVWTGSLEIAELHAERIQACGPDPDRVDAGAKRLGVTVEVLPGG